MENKVSASTIIRTIILAIALFNQVLTSFGKNPLPISESDLYNVLTEIFTIVAAIVAWWENNSFTKAAIAADRVYDEIKSGIGETEDQAEG